MKEDFFKFKNINIWTHISYMHSKIMYFDRIATSIGTFNFDHYSADSLYESTIICQDTKLNTQVDQSMVLDMANSVPLNVKN